jgi:hypothetical protein
MGKAERIVKPRIAKMRQKQKINISSALSIRSKGAKGIPKCWKEKTKMEGKIKKETEVESFSHP